MPIEKKDKKEKRNKIIVSLILVLIMGLSTLGYSFYNSEKQNYNEKEYNNIKMSFQEDGLWHFYFQDYEFATRYTPDETANITGIINSNLYTYQNLLLYFSSDSDYEGMEEIAKNIGRFTQRYQQVCLKECEENLPVKNCSSDNIIIIKESNETLIKQEENCIYIFGQQGEILRATDWFIFKILGI